MQRLPDLFTRLTAADWARVRESAAGLRPGEEEALMVSVGYIDVGKLPGGLAFVAANSMLDGRDQAYRKVMQPGWGGAAPRKVPAARSKALAPYPHPSWQGSGATKNKPWILTVMHENGDGHTDSFATRREADEDAARWRRRSGVRSVEVYKD